MRLRMIVFPLASLAVVVCSTPATGQAPSLGVESFSEMVRPYDSVDREREVRRERARIEAARRDARSARRHLEMAIEAPRSVERQLRRCLAGRVQDIERQCSLEALSRTKERAERNVARSAELAARALERDRVRRIRVPRER